MKKAFYALAASLFLACGCCSVEICRSGGHDMCYICTSEWTLVDTVPLFSGDPDGGPFLLFADTANIKTNINLLEKAMSEGNYVRVKNLVSFTTEEAMIPILLSRKLFHTSAELVMASSASAKPECNNKESANDDDELIRALKALDNNTK